MCLLPPLLLYLIFFGDAVPSRDTSPSRHCICVRARALCCASWLQLYEVAHKDKDAHAVDFVSNCLRQKVPWSQPVHCFAQLLTLSCAMVALERYAGCQ